MFKAIKYVYSAIIDLIFPDRCVICNKEDGIICHGCLKSLKPLPSHSIEPVSGIDKIYCYGEYTGNLKTVIKKLKFSKKQKIANILGEKMAEMLKPNISTLEDIVLIPVPLHKKREIERGFNQSLLLCLTISEKLRLPYLENEVIRDKDTEYMHSLSKKDRLKNVKDAFKINNPTKLKNKTVIIIDDILTTGATISQIGKLLKTNKSGKIIGATCAMATATPIIKNHKN